MKQKLIFIILCVLVNIFFLANSVPSLAQTGELRGLVSDTDSGEGIPFANISTTIDGILVGAQTDFDGFYEIKPLPPNTYEIKISYVGYQEKIIQNVIVEADRSTRLNIQLKEQKDLLETIEIEEYKVPLLKGCNMRTGATITKEQIASLPIRSVQIVKKAPKKNVRSIKKTSTRGEIHNFNNGHNHTSTGISVSFRNGRPHSINSVDFYTK